MIKEITTQNELEQSVRVLKESFGPVAREFNLTEENCPTNTAFITLKKLKDLKTKGIRMFGMFLSGKQIGFVALEKASETLYYVEKLAVVPGFRHQGNGKMLMNFVCDYVKKIKGKKISIGIINEHTVLKNWYTGYGFLETGTKQFKHLPFTVCFMEKEIN